MPRCVICGDVIHGVICYTRALERVHWGCVRLAAERTRTTNGSRRNARTSCFSRSLTGDEGGAQQVGQTSGEQVPHNALVSRNSFTSEETQKPMSWLAPWLKSMMLSRHLKEATGWCESMGAADIEEVKENWEAFAEFLKLDGSEWKRCAEACNRAVGSDPVCFSASFGSVDRTVSRLGSSPSLVVGVHNLDGIDLGMFAVTSTETVADLKARLELMGLGCVDSKLTFRGVVLKDSSILFDSGMPPESTLTLLPQVQRRVNEDVETFGPTNAPYTLLEQVGRGATAIVYRCIRDGEQFAVKVINLQKLRMRPQSDHILRVLNREAGLHSSLRHNNIVQLRDVVETPNKLFLVMDLVEGGELIDYVTARGRMTEDEARPVFLQIVEALQYIHAKNIVHRDLKLDNILVDSRTSRPGFLAVKLSDFGHSKLLHDGYTRALTACGTPLYWAPEQGRARSFASTGYDERVDLWSLGVVLYAMLEGSLPFETPSIAQEGQFMFRGSREADELIRGLIRIDPGERMSLDECLHCPWVMTGLSRAQFAPGERSPGFRKDESDLMIRLPRAPTDVSLFKTDLLMYSRKHQVNASLHLLQVVVSSQGKIEDTAWNLAREELEQILVHHMPELNRQGLFDDGSLVDEETAAARGEERGALEAIYGSDFETLSDVEWLVRLRKDTAIRIYLSPGYPCIEPPKVAIECGCRSEPISLVDELTAQWTEGNSCVCHWVDCVRQSLADTLPLEDPSSCVDLSLWGSESAKNTDLERAAAAEHAEFEGSKVSGFKPHRRGTHVPKSVKGGQRQHDFDKCSEDPSHCVDLIHGETLIDRKSKFQAHVARVSSIEQVKWAHRQLLSDPNVASATHNIVAYRFRDGIRGTLISDYDDDNEKGAGSRLATLLDNRSEDDAFVMITRWFGGVELGPDRYKNINLVAKLLLEQSQSSKRAAAKTGASGKKAKRMPGRKV